MSSYIYPTNFNLNPIGWFVFRMVLIITYSSIIYTYIFVSRVCKTLGEQSDYCEPPWSALQHFLLCCWYFAIHYIFGYADYSYLFVACDIAASVNYSCWILTLQDDSRRVASTLFPSMSSLLKRKKDHGIYLFLIYSIVCKHWKVNCFMNHRIINCFW